MDEEKNEQPTEPIQDNTPENTEPIQEPAMNTNTTTSTTTSTNSQNAGDSKGLSIAALVLGIISLVSGCLWYFGVIISIPAAILAIIFGIIRINKPGKGMAIGGLVTGIISLCLWVILFVFAFSIGFMAGLSGEGDTVQTFLNNLETSSIVQNMTKITKVSTIIIK